MDLGLAPFPEVDDGDLDSPEITVRPINLGDFAWPPSPSRPILPQTPLAATKPQARWRACIDSVECTLLGRTALSFARQVSNENWHPDHETRYCWRCGSSIGEHEADGEGCASCRNTKLHWDQAVRVSDYDGAVRDAVLALKFHRWRTSGYELGCLLGEQILTRMDRAQIMPNEVVLVPIPMPHRRRLSRGVDHTQVLCEGAKRSTGCQIVRGLGAIHRPEQVGLTMSARGRNMKGAFRVNHRGLNRAGDRCRVIVVVDDVRTTGATLTAACKTLRGVICTPSKGGQSAPKREIWVCTAGVASGKARDRRILKI